MGSGEDAKRARVVPGSVTAVTRKDGTIVYLARLTYQGRRKAVGYFPTEEEAWRKIVTWHELHDDNARGLTLASWGEVWLERRETDGVHRSAKKDRSRWRAHIATAPFALWSLRKIEARDIRAWVRGLLRTEARHVDRSVRVLQVKGSGGVPSGTRDRLPGNSSGSTALRGGATQTAGLGRRLARQTVVNAFNLLRRCLADAVEDNKLESNPAREVEVPRVAKSEDGWTWLTADEIARVLAARRPRRAPAVSLNAITLAIYTGLRAGELWGLRWCDVVLDGRRPELHVQCSYKGSTKSGKSRHVPLLPQALAVLRGMRRGIGKALVFPGPGGKGYGEGYDAAWNSWKKSAGITRRARFHDLRHTCGSHLLQGTWTPRALRLEEIQKWLGHASITTTERYAHLAPGGLHDAVAWGDEEKGVK